MKYRHLLLSAGVAIILIANSLALSGIVAAAPGASDYGVLVQEWTDDFQWYPGMYFGSSSAVADLGVNNMGSDPDSDLEIVTGSDEFGAGAAGVWRIYDSQGNLEGWLPTQTDEARSSPAIADIDGDGDLEIAGGTTSGWYVQVFDPSSNFVWTFPTLTGFQMGGPFVWPSSPALADVVGDEALEVIIGNRWLGSVWCFDGDPTDGIDEGITITNADFPWGYSLGSEGDDWDVLWVFDTGIDYDEVISSPAVGDVDNDGQLEVVIGSNLGNLYVLSAGNGTLEHVFVEVVNVDASPAIADIDKDSLLEIVVGSISDDNVYCLEWDGMTGSVQWNYPTGGPVYSSAAIGDVDLDYSYEIVVGSYDGNVYCLSATGGLEWSYATGAAVHSSPALALRSSTEFGIYVGCHDNFLYLLDSAGNLIDRFETYGPIGVSPTVADVEADGKLEVFLYDWGSSSTLGGHTYWAIEDSGSTCDEYAIEWGMFRHDTCHTGTYPLIKVSVDIKPMGWPNPLNVNGKGVLPVAILGTAGFDVTQIDPATIRLEGVAPLRWALEDVGSPDDPLAGPDGFTDLTLKFDTQEIVAALGDVNDGDEIVLHLTGNLKEECGGTPIEGEDVVLIIKKK